MFQSRILGSLPVVLVLLSGRTAIGASNQQSESPLLQVLVVKEVAVDFQANGEVIAREATGHESELRAPFEIPPGQASVEVTLALPRQGSWWFGAEGRGLFSKPKLASFPLESRRIAIEIRPLVKVNGRVSTSAGNPIEGRDALVRWRAPGSPDTWGSVRAAISAGRIETEIPAGTWNLDVKVTGCASDRREGTVARHRETMDLGAVSAVPGASLVGRLASRDTVSERVLKNTRVTLTPAGEIPGAGAVGDGTFLATEARPSPLGEFQFAGLAQGRYNLRVFADGFAREDRVVDLVQDMEIELREPILLARPASLQVDLSPSLDPLSLPWTVELREKGEAGWLLGAEVTRTSRAGVAHFEGVRLKGEYIAVVRAGNGDAWRVQSVMIDAAKSRLSLRLDSAQVAGQLTLGGEPLAAELVFGGKNVAPSIKTKSGNDGQFRVELPRAGAWNVSISTSTPRVSRDVSVAVSEPKDGLPARIQIALPATRLRVRVVDNAGAQLTKSCLIRLESVSTNETQTEETRTGEVEAVGLEVGEWIVYAESARAVSERKSVTIEMDDREEVTLTLAEKKVVKGVVVSTLGMPVPYARLQPLRWDSRADAFPPPVISDAIGRFQLQVPPDVARLAFLVLAPGYAVTTALVPVSESAIATVQVPLEGGRVRLSFETKSFPSPGMPYVSDGSLTFLGMLFRSSPEIVVDFRDGRTIVEIPSFRAGPFGICRSALVGASDAETVGRDCVFGSVTPGRDVVLDLGESR